MCGCELSDSHCITATSPSFLLLKSPVSRSQTCAGAGAASLPLRSRSRCRRGSIQAGAAPGRGPGLGPSPSALTSVPASPPHPASRIPPAAMAASPAYGEEKGGSSSLGEPEYGHDPASGGIFSSDYKRWGQCGHRGQGRACPCGRHCRPWPLSSAGKWYPSRGWSGPRTWEREQGRGCG